MTNPHQTNSVEEVVEEIIERYNIDPEMAFGRPWLTQKLTTLVSEAKREGREELGETLLLRAPRYQAKWNNIDHPAILIQDIELALTTDSATRTISSDKK